MCWSGCGSATCGRRLSSTSSTSGRSGPTSWKPTGVCGSALERCMTDIIADARIQRHFPALVEAATVVGSVQIRNRATLAGNICNASPAADTAPVLLVHRAAINLIGSAGPRRVPLHEFFIGPGRTVLGAGELVESIDLPFPSEMTWRGVWPRDTTARRRPGHGQSVLPRDGFRQRAIRLRRRRAAPVRGRG